MKQKRQFSGWAARVVTPRQALLASMVVLLLCGWSFLVVFFGWPRVWAQVFYPLCLFFAPALLVLAGRELWRNGWDVRHFFTLLFSIIGVAFWCGTTYFIIHRVTIAA
jgi:hypothetical protein